MAQLIQMRQRIKAIETIKKITHAMRLISMSMHSRLRHRAPLLENYQKEVSLMFDKVRFAATDWKNVIMQPDASPESNQLVILIGSQKGLCGNFNTSLFQLFQETFPEATLADINIITVGKHAVDYMNKRSAGRMVKTFSDFSSARLGIIAGRIVNSIAHAKKPYSSVVVVANALETFFIQRPQTTTVLPLKKEFPEKTDLTPKEAYTWEQSPHEILDDLALQYLTAHIHHLLFQSLLSEQASRFLSMDNSTRNAKQLLEDTQLLYNKMRQAKITRELTELSASF